MYKKYIHISFLIIALLVSNVVSAACCVNPFYARVEVGGSFAHCARICADTNFWDESPEGYNSSLCRAPLFGLELGVNVNPWFAFGFSATHRSKFKYCKFQTSTASNTVNFAGNKTRFFDFDNTSFMFDLYFNRSGFNSWGYKCCNFAIIPYFGIGGGWSNNAIHNFHSVLERSFTVGTFTGNPVTSIATYHSQIRGAWQAQVGVDFYANRCVAFGIGYRYFDGGCVRSSNHVIINSSDSVFRNASTAPAWTFKFRTHEVVGTLSLEF